MLRPFIVFSLLISINSFGEIIFPEGDVITDIEETETDLALRNYRNIDAPKELKEASSEFSDLKKFNDLSTTRVIKNKSRYKYYKNRGDVPVYLAVLKKGSTLHDIDKDDSLKIKKSIYVRTRLTHPGSEFNFIVSKKGKINYITPSTNLNSIEKIISLHPNYNTKKKYKAEESFRMNDKLFTLENSFQIETESKNVEYFQRNIDGIDSNSANSLNFKYSLFAKTKLPVDFGITTSYQSTSMNNTNSSTSWTSLFLGAAIKYNAWDYQKWSLNIGLEAGRSLFDGLSVQTSSATTDYQFSTSYYSLFGELIYGSFSIGTYYTNYKSSISNFSTVEANLSSEKLSNSGIGLKLGYKFEIDI